MGVPHKHRDVIIAWANGEKVQYFDQIGDRGWVDIDEPVWSEKAQYRIKPKRVKREGWVNVYPSMSYAAYIGCVFETQEAANRNENNDRQACIRIEWEEEE